MAMHIDIKQEEKFVGFLTRRALPLFTAALVLITAGCTSEQGLDKPEDQDPQGELGSPLTKEEQINKLYKEMGFPESFPAELELSTDLHERLAASSLSYLLDSNKLSKILSGEQRQEAIKELKSVVLGSVTHCEEATLAFAVENNQGELFGEPPNHGFLETVFTEMNIYMEEHGLIGLSAYAKTLFAKQAEEIEQFKDSLADPVKFQTVEDVDDAKEVKQGQAAFHTAADEGSIITYAVHKCTCVVTVPNNTGSETVKIGLAHIDPGMSLLEVGKFFSQAKSNSNEIKVNILGGVGFGTFTVWQLGINSRMATPSINLM